MNFIIIFVGDSSRQPGFSQCMASKKLMHFLYLRIASYVYAYITVTLYIYCNRYSNSYIALPVSILHDQ